VIANVGKYKFNRVRKVGELTITLPEPPPTNKIDGYKLSHEKQRFHPPVLPEGIDDRWIGVDPDAGELTDEDWLFLRREANRFRYGYWFMNNGNVEYLTGNHYFYVAYWKIPVVINGRKRLGLPNFIDSDRDYWYFWERCKTDLSCVGMIFVTNRRDGKTYKGTCTLYFDSIHNAESHSGIQSKTGDDALQVFNKLVKSWQVLPEIWKPIDEGSSHPKKALRFYDPTTRSSKVIKKKRVEALRSEIDWKNVKSEAYDG